MNVRDPRVMVSQFGMRPDQSLASGRGAFEWSRLNKSAIGEATIGDPMLAKA